jgi:hypothetical protein
MTCNEWEAVDASVEYLDKQPRYTRERQLKYQNKQREKRVDEFAERVKKKDENTNTQTESNN